MELRNVYAFEPTDATVQSCDGAPVSAFITAFAPIALQSSACPRAKIATSREPIGINSKISFTPDPQPPSFSTGSCHNNITVPGTVDDP